MMAKHAPHWDDLMTLAALARAGSYSACARELGMTHATVMRRIKRLEMSFQWPVLTPSSNGIQLTPGGHMALSAARQMEEAADKILRKIDAATGTVCGLVRVTTTEALGTQFLTRRLPTFQTRHPGVLLEMLIDNKNLSLARRKAHIAVRLKRPQEAHVVAKRAARMSFGLYGSTNLVSNARQSGGFASITYCKLDVNDPTLPETSWVSEHVPDHAISYVSNSLTGVMNAAEEGLGAAVLPVYLAAQSPRLALLRPLPEISREVWIAFPPEYRDEPRFRAVIDWLMEILQQHVT
jgi:DNA-binding transcriptional LysR family regulator